MADNIYITLGDPDLLFAKVGREGKDNDRLKNYMTPLPRCQVLHTFSFPDKQSAIDAEKRLHEKFFDKRVGKNKMKDENYWLEDIPEIVDYLEKLPNAAREKIKKKESRAKETYTRLNLETGEVEEVYKQHTLPKCGVPGCTNYAQEVRKDSHGMPIPRKTVLFGKEEPICNGHHLLFMDIRRTDRNRNKEEEFETNTLDL